MSASDAVARMLVLVPWLLERPGATVADAAAAVGATPAQVVRDLDVLQYCGLPGRLGGDLFEVELTGDRVVLRLAPVFDRPVRPTPAEALGLVLALDTVAAGLGDQLPALGGAVAALRDAAGVPAGAVPSLDDGRAWLPPLRAAVDAGRAVRLTYRGRGDASPRERDVEPWELVLHRGHWYVHAHDRGAAGHRTFRLDRVQEVELTHAAQAARPAGPLPTPAWQPGPDDVEVELRIGPGGRWVLGLLDAVEVASSHDHPSGSDEAAHVRVATDAPRLLVDLTLAAAGAVEIVGPAWIRAAVVERARAGLARHGDNHEERR